MHYLFTTSHSVMCCLIALLAFHGATVPATACYEGANEVEACRAPLLGTSMSKQPLWSLATCRLNAAYNQLTTEGYIGKNIFSAENYLPS